MKNRLEIVVVLVASLMSLGAADLFADVAVVPVAENINTTAAQPALPQGMDQEYKRLAEEEAKLLQQLSAVEQAPPAEKKQDDKAAQAEKTSHKADDKQVASLVSKAQDKAVAENKKQTQVKTNKPIAPEAKLITSLQGSNLDLVNKLKERDNKVTQLEQEIDEMRQRLMVAETEVERLRAHLDQRNRASLSPFLGGATKPLAAQAPALKRPAAAALSASEVDLPILTVVVDKAALRAGPGADNSELMSVGRGTRLTVETRSPDGAWFRVFAPNGTRAWVSAEVVSFNSVAPVAVSSARKEKEAVSSSPYDKEAENRALENIKALKK